MITKYFTFVIAIIFFSTLNVQSLDKFNKEDKISDYFSGILLLNQGSYSDSYNYLKKLNGLENRHKIYSRKYLLTLINSGNISQALNYSKKLEKNKLTSFESDLVIGINHFKNSKYYQSRKFFLNSKNRKNRSILDNYITSSLINWSELENLKFNEAIVSLNKLDNRFENLKKIQEVFLSCFYGRSETDGLFNKLISDETTDFSRYAYFYANYLKSINKNDKAKQIINDTLKLYPRNLLLNQYKINLEKNLPNSNFDCKKKQHVLAEIIYIAANALSSQSVYSLSNFYLNFSKYLNPNFYAFDILLAENYYKIEKFEIAKKVYKKLSKYGSSYNWYSNKQISKILAREGKNEQAIKLLKNTFSNLKYQNIYDNYDYAEFLKNNEKFKESIKYYSLIIENINKDHPLYPEVTDSRGVAYERIGLWNKAEKDLIASLEASPDQPYVINYLAYSWIEKGIKVEKSLKMLERANQLKSNDPYIIDSLGWALFKLKRYEESKKYLQTAVKLMPADPIVNDHYGDVLWKNGYKIQARYYWEYVLNLKKTDQSLKLIIEKKLIKGL